VSQGVVENVTWILLQISWRIRQWKKIGQYLSKLWTNVQWRSCFTHCVL